MGALAQIARALAELVAPPACAACELPLLAADVTGFCAGCALILESPPPAQRPPARAATAFVYGGPLADAVTRMKYAGRSDLAPVLGRLLAAAALPLAGRVDLVVPIPLHAARLRERGYNQSALLARPVARALGVPLDTGALSRVRPTQVQASLPRDRRRENVRGAFVARPRSGRVLLVDDVRTTGATLASAALALRAAGDVQLRTLTLAWAVG